VTGAESVDPGVGSSSSAKFDFFICYPGEESKAAGCLHDMLVAGGARVFLDTVQLKPGDAWDRQILDGQRSSLNTIALLSAANDASWYDKEEIAEAIALSRDSNGEHRLVPVLLENVDQPYGFRRLVSIKTYEIGLESTAKQLLAELRASSRADQFVRPEMPTPTLSVPAPSSPLRASRPALPAIDSPPVGSPGDAEDYEDSSNAAMAIAGGVLMIVVLIVTILFLVNSLP